VWIKPPAGAARQAGSSSSPVGLQGGDTIIDGGGTFWKDDISALRKGFGDHVEPREV